MLSLHSIEINYNNFNLITMGKSKDQFLHLRQSRKEQRHYSVQNVINAQINLEPLQRIKDYCIKVDTINNIGTSKEIELYYKDISFKKLLHIYIEYNGLKCYRKEEPQDYKDSYSIDMISLLEILKQ